MLDYLIERSGVIREPVEGRVDFVHRTVQEYLTARAAAEVGDVEPLVLNAHRDQWREVVVMAAGHANAPLREELLDGLLTRMAAEPRHRRRLKIVVCACLETLPAVPERLREAVDRCLDDLVPPRDLATARSLSLAGQIILDRLPADLRGLSPAAARACVTTAHLINGPAALDLLARYASDDRVRRALVEAWRYFEPNVYADRVLSAMETPPERLIVETPGQLNAVRGLPPQRRIHLNVVKVRDLSPLLAHRESLVGLTLNSDLSEADLEVVSRLSALTELTMVGVGELGFLTGLRHLTGLFLANIPSVTDFSPLSGLTGLREIVIVGAASLTTWDCLPPLHSLSELSLSEVPVVTSVREIAERAPRLRSLHLGEYDSLADLDAVSGLKLDRLSLLDIRAIDDISALSGCGTLTWLDLQRIPVHDLRPLVHLDRLTHLDLTGCPALRDLSALAQLGWLRTLHLSGAPAGLDLAPLAANPQLEVWIKTGQEVRNGHLLGRRLKHSTY
ncbi:leucine-rich repeat domain-containing protein [Nonomuraea jiangxiensis]|uniref:Leucine-rich repeat (LRR) protein n=1 Tax=Nonomuraea jiangxiensis TaxID=633440 RepID=A0A1G8WG37_9ACTN|nr:leucine-rich repeat domain-containing protein [Nonomuraea jiangxiensis]SDJ76500.1 Leucine-rich repeat (LRR) protein [Nonomuraea jiangxiensis]